MVDGQRASPLRFAVQAFWNALLPFDLLPTGFSNRDLCRNKAELRGETLDLLPKVT